MSMNTYSSHQGHTSIESAVPEAALTPLATAMGKPVSPERMRTCGHCQYDGPLQVRHIYPLLLRWYMIAAGFALGVLPGIFLLSWRRNTAPTMAMTCPLCLFLRLEPAPSATSRPIEYVPPAYSPNCSSHAAASLDPPCKRDSASVR